MLFLTVIFTAGGSEVVSQQRLSVLPHFTVSYIQLRYRISRSEQLLCDKTLPHHRTFSITPTKSH